MTAEQTPQMVRPKESRMIAGGAAGLADRFRMSRGMMRLLFVRQVAPTPSLSIGAHVRQAAHAEQLPARHLLCALT